MSSASDSASISAFISASASASPDYGRLVNETTANWLERLIGMGAPDSIRANVQAILVSEQQPAGNPPQPNSFNRIFVLYCF